MTAAKNLKSLRATSCNFVQLRAAARGRVKSIQGVTVIRNLNIRHPRSLLGCSPRTVVDRCWGSVCVPREVRYWE